MASNPKLERALQALKDHGHTVGQIGYDPTDPNWRHLYEIDGEPNTYEQVVERAEELGVDLRDL